MEYALKASDLKVSEDEFIEQIGKVLNRGLPTEVADAFSAIDAINKEQSFIKTQTRLNDAGNTLEETIASFAQYENAREVLTAEYHEALMSYIQAHRTHTQEQTHPAMKKLMYIKS